MGQEQGTRNSCTGFRMVQLHSSERQSKWQSNWYAGIKQPGKECHGLSHTSASSRKTHLAPTGTASPLSAMKELFLLQLKGTVQHGLSALIVSYQGQNWCYLSSACVSTGTGGQRGGHCRLRLGSTLYED